MQLVEPVIHQGSDAEERLIELGLNRQSLERVAQAAVGARNDSTAHDPANAPGLFSYIYGTRKLRDEFVGEDWEIDQTEGVEAIKNEQLNIKVVFQNVDVACQEDIPPQPRSKKGAGSERICQGNLFPNSPIPSPEPGWLTYYLMVTPDGDYELSQPIVRNGKFDAFIERIFIGIAEPLDIDPLENDAPLNTDDFDIDVTRKR